MLLMVMLMIILAITLSHIIQWQCLMIIFDNAVNDDVDNNFSNIIIKDYSMTHSIIISDDDVDNNFSNNVQQ